MITGHHKHMTRPPISVTVIAFNEEDHIAHAIQSAQWAEEILVIDSGSTDKTVEIAKNLGARVLINPWPGYGQQKNFASKMATYDWILNIDADEVIPRQLADEIQNCLAKIQRGELQAHGFYFPRKSFYLGRWIRKGGWYPNHLVRLSHRKYSHWTEPHVHEQLEVDGETIGLIQALHHYTFANIQEQILTNLKFSQLGYQDLKKAGKAPSRIKLILKPLGKFIETYFIKMGFLDGLPGFIISINAAHSMFLKYAYLIEDSLKNENPDHR